MLLRTFCCAALLLGSTATAFAETPLEQAAKAGDLAKVEALVKAGADVNAVDAENGVWERTALMQAARQGHADVVKYLLAHGADVKRQGDASGAMPLRAAAYEGHLAVVELLLAAGAPVDEDVDTNGRTPLLWAIIGKQPQAPQVVEALLKAGANSRQEFEGFDGSKQSAAQLAEKAGPEVLASFQRNAR